MSVDVLHLLGQNLGVGEGFQHDASRPAAVLSWRRNVVRITRHAVTDDFCQDRGIAPLGKPQLFEDNDARSLAHHEAVAVQVKWPAGFLRSIIARGEGAHRGESADTHRCDRRFGAAANHNVGFAPRDESKRIADSVRARRASGACSRVRALGSTANGNESGGQIDNGGGNEEERYPAGSTLEQRRVLALYDVEPANAGSDVDTHAVGELGQNLQARLFKGKLRCGQSELDEQPHLLQFLFFDELKGVEAFHFRGKLRGKAGGIKVSDRPDAALAREQVTPSLFRAHAEGTDQSDAGHDHSSRQACASFGNTPPGQFFVDLMWDWM